MNASAKGFTFRIREVEKDVGKTVRFKECGWD
jgi:hypothetical protein